jgi:hypothetical protein
MYYSQRLNFFLGLSLVVLSLVSASQSNAQTVEVDSLASKSKTSDDSSSSSGAGGDRVGEALAAFLSTDPWYGIGSSKTEENVYLAANTNRSSDSDTSLVPKEAEKSLKQGSTGVTLLTATWEENKGNKVTSVFGDRYPASLKLDRVINDTNQTSVNSLLVQLPIEESTLPDSATLPEFRSSSLLVSVPESSPSVLPWLGLAALGFLPNRLKSKK